MTDAGIAVNVQKMILNLKPVHQHAAMILWLYLISLATPFWEHFFDGTNHILVYLMPAPLRKHVLHYLWAPHEFKRLMACQMT